MQQEQFHLLSFFYQDLHNFADARHKGTYTIKSQNKTTRILCLLSFGDWSPFLKEEMKI